MEPKWLSEREQQSWRAFVTAHARLMAQLDQELIEGHDLTLPEYEVLAHLSEAEHWQLRMHELAALCGLSPSGLTRRFDTMCRHGMVTRRRCDADRRGVYATLTTTGYARLRAAAPTHVAGVRRLFIDVFSTDELPNLEGMVSRIAVEEPEVAEQPGAMTDGAVELATDHELVAAGVA